MDSEGIRTVGGHEGKQIFRLIVEKARLISARFGDENIESATPTNRAQRRQSGGAILR